MQTTRANKACSDQPERETPSRACTTGELLLARAYLAVGGFNDPISRVPISVARLLRLINHIVPNNHQAPFVAGSPVGQRHALLLAEGALDGINSGASQVAAFAVGPCVSYPSPHRQFSKSLTSCETLLLR